MARVQTIEGAEQESSGWSQKVQRRQRRHDVVDDTVSVLYVTLLSILFPPIGVIILSGFGADLLISLLFTLLLGWLPGIVHALYVEYVYFTRRELAQDGALEDMPAPFVFSRKVQSGGMAEQPRYAYAREQVAVPTQELGVVQGPLHQVAVVEVPKETPAALEQTPKQAAVIEAPIDKGAVIETAKEKPAIIEVPKDSEHAEKQIAVVEVSKEKAVVDEHAEKKAEEHAEKKAEEHAKKEAAADEHAERKEEVVVKP